LPQNGSQIFGMLSPKYCPLQSVDCSECSPSPSCPHWPSHQLQNTAATTADGNSQSGSMHSAISKNYGPKPSQTLYRCIMRTIEQLLNYL